MKEPWISFWVNSFLNIFRCFFNSSKSSLSTKLIKICIISDILFHSDGSINEWQCQCFVWWCYYSNRECCFIRGYDLWWTTLQHDRLILTCWFCIASSSLCTSYFPLLMFHNLFYLPRNPWGIWIEWGKRKKGRYLIYCTQHISELTIIRFAQSQNIGNAKNLKVFCEQENLRD